MSDHISISPRSNLIGEPQWRPWAEILRARNAPYRVVADMVLADFTRRADASEREWQKKFDAGEIDRSTFLRAIESREQEQEAELRQALGEDGYRAWQRDEILRPFATAGIALDGAEQQQLFESGKTLRDKQRELETRYRNGQIDDGLLHSQLSALSDDHLATVKRILGEERYRGTQQEPEGEGANLRRLMSYLKVPPEKAEALVDLDQAREILHDDLNEQVGSGALSVESAQARRLAILAARDQSYEKILGPTGFDEFQKATDSRYEALRHFAPAWNLNTAEVGAIYSALQQQDRAIRDRQIQAVRAERNGQAVDWNEIRQQTQVIHEQTEQRLRQALGPERVERIKQQGVLSPR